MFGYVSKARREAAANILAYTRSPLCTPTQARMISDELTRTRADKVWKAIVRANAANGRMI
jgi:hypothetical protein